MTSGWRPALRFARRSIRRSPGRSLLIALLIAVPVAGATTADLVFRTNYGGEHDADKILGTADAAVIVTGQPQLGDRVFPTLDHAYRLDDAAGMRDPAEVDVQALLPPGTRVVLSSEQTWNTWISDGDRDIRVNSLIATLDDPLTSHQVRLESGRWPQADDEALVTPALAERLELLDGAGDLRPGASLGFQDGPAVTVTGVALQPFDLRAETLITAHGSAVADHLEASIETRDEVSDIGTIYLADLPAEADPDALWPLLAKDGVLMVPRDAVVDPARYLPDGRDTYDQPVIFEVVGVIALIMGLGAFEVILLAGAAFAVGARRQVRDLGLMAANGASGKHIRHIVLVQGAMLGGLGALGGVVLGGLATVATKPLWERATGMLIETWRFGPAEVLAAAGLGLLSGLAAAIVPAVGAARMKPVDALQGRFRVSRLAARMPVVGIVLAVVGAGGALIASRVAASDLAEYGERLVAAEGTGHFLEPPTTAVHVALQLLGAAVAIAGLVIVIPGLVSVLARGARRLPISGRLALRDSARHRHRTAPTVAAIAIVVAGSVGLATAGHGADRQDQLQYRPYVPPNTIAVDVDMPEEQDIHAQIAEVTEAATAHLPDVNVWAGSYAASTYVDGETSPLFGEACPGCVEEGRIETLWLGDDDGISMAVAGGADEPDIRAALGRGEIVVFDASLLNEGQVTLTDAESDDGTPSTTLLPAHATHRDEPYTGLPGALIPPEVVADLSLSMIPGSTLIGHGQVTPDELDTALNAMEATGAYTIVEEGWTSSYAVVTLVLNAIAAVVTLVGVAVAVALSAVESRADLATLAAVGAQPRRRRTLAGSQAMVVAGTGVALGIAFGLYVAYMSWPTVGPPEFTVPWTSIAVIGLAVPALAVAVAMICTPGRLPLVRRMT